MSGFAVDGVSTLQRRKSAPVSDLNQSVSKRRNTNVRVRRETVGERPLLRLTRRQGQIVSLLLAGCTNAQIAERLGVSDQTVKNQLSALYQKSGVKNRLELALLALRAGFKLET